MAHRSGYTKPFSWEFCLVSGLLRGQSPSLPNGEDWPMPAAFNDPPYEEQRQAYQNYRSQVLASEGFYVDRYYFGPFDFYGIITPIIKPEDFAPKAAAYAVEKYNRKKRNQGNPLTFETVSRANGQLVDTGIFLYITLTASHGAGKRKYEAKVYLRSGVNAAENYILCFFRDAKYIPDLA